MKLLCVLLTCAFLPACAATSPEQQPPGMPLDKELMPGDPGEALTAR